MVKTKVLSWKCPACGLVIESIYPNQLKFNKGLHVEYHTNKKLSEDKK